MGSVIRGVMRRRLRRERRQARAALGRRWGWIALALLALGLTLPVSGVAAGLGVLYLRGVELLPEPVETIYLDPLIGPTELYDRDGRTLIYAVQDPLGDSRTWVELDDLPPYLIEATLAMEDPDFLRVTRFDAVVTFGRLWATVFGDGLPPEDATLTGRLVHNAVFDPPDYPTFADRALEIALVSEVNRRYTPQETLEWHLNTNFYGHEAYGIEAAAQVYLGKSAAALTLADAALLAAIPPAPQFNPLDNPTAALGRRNDLLRTLLVGGLISQTDYEAATADPLRLVTSSTADAQIAPEFAEYARRQAEEILIAEGLDGARLVARGGLRIITTLDLDLQTQATCALRTQMARVNGLGDPPVICPAAALLSPMDSLPNPPPDEGTIVVIDVATGELRALVGDGTTARYQPTVTLQPFVYFEGFRTYLYDPGRMVLDIAQPLPGAREGLVYIPSNRDGIYRGPMNLRDAMSAWLLPPAAEVASRVQFNSMLANAHRIGINTLTEGVYDTSLLERGGSVSALDMAFAYSVFAAMGEMRGVPGEPVAREFRVRNPTAVLRVEDAQGNLLWARDGAAVPPVRSFPAGLAYLINDVLSDSAARRATLDNLNDLPVRLVDTLGRERPAAVVSGAAHNNRDAWTLGYTPQFVVAVRVGRQDTGEMLIDPRGFNGAAPVWRAVMQYIHDRDGLTVQLWERPNDVTVRMVCETSGLAPNGVCPTYEDVFLQGPAPATDSYWQRIAINTQTGRLATQSTPAGLRAEEVFFVPPDAALDWWEQRGLPLPPTELDVMTAGDLQSANLILVPQALSYVGGVVDVRGTVDRTNLASYQLSYGQGFAPEQWFNITDPQTAYVEGALLGRWDTTLLDGAYTLRLTVTLTNNQVEESVVFVTVDNVPPGITLSAGTDAAGNPRVYRFPGDALVTIEAEATDQYGVERVEFYANEEFLAVDTSWPFSADWQITRAGAQTFTAVAFDQVGNRAQTELVVEIVR